MCSTSKSLQKVIAIARSADQNQHKIQATGRAAASPRSTTDFEHRQAPNRSPCLVQIILATTTRHLRCLPDNVSALGEHQQQGHLAQGRGRHALLLHLREGRMCLAPMLTSCKITGQKPAPYGPARHAPRAGSSSGPRACSRPGPWPCTPCHRSPLQSFPVSHNYPARKTHADASVRRARLRIED